MNLFAHSYQLHISSIYFVFFYAFRLHGNIESMAILSFGAEHRNKRDSIVLTFKDAKITVMEFDDSMYGLRTR